MSESQYGILAIGGLVAAGAWYVMKQSGQGVTETVQQATQQATQQAQETASQATSGGSSGSDGPAVSGFDDPDFDTAQSISAGVTVDAIESGAISDPVTTDSGTTLDDASGYIGHTGL